ncbi:Ig-like domain-containing protein [Streptomyces sp. RS10V-4]|uniref:Ig-like domain-containing protein n=1 Tax=Streptomyces rhizoryzae TaxID=2932493 RepID=UPI002004C821|nr:Ig-like domain-containing protein [Streptomyces rhizoryzae]MCK7625689.1 Ig-like domain-containing protein [Streptomyces rhizoryzae]
MSQSPARSSRPFRPSRSLCAAFALMPVLGFGTLAACDAAKASASPERPVKVALGSAGGHPTVQAGDQLRVSADGGVLTEVTVTDPRGRQLVGGFSRGGTVWTSRAKAAPDTKYSVLALTRDPGGARSAAKESLTTGKVAKRNRLTFTPRPGGAVVRAGDPITLTFAFPVRDRAAVERRLEVVTDNRTEGAWSWESAGGRDRIVWRPEGGWKPGTKVMLRAELNGVDSGGGRFFTKDYGLRFTVGRGPAVKADLDADAYITPGLGLTPALWQGPGG